METRTSVSELAREIKTEMVGKEKVVGTIDRMDGIDVTFLFSNLV